MSTVFIAKVRGFKPPCQFNPGALREAAEAAVQQTLGLDALRGASVLVKPNLCNWLPHSKGATVQIETMQTLVSLLRDHGAKRITVGEGCAEKERSTLELFDRYGYKQLQGIELLDFNDASLPRLTLANSISLPQALEESDVVLNVAKMKTHVQSVVTLSLKNAKGLLLPADKKKSHFVGVAQTVAELNQALLQYLHEQGKRYLAMIDGLVAMEGFGPTAGKDKSTGLLLAGTEPLSLDVTATRIMGIDPALVPMLQAAKDKGLGEMDGDKIQIIGSTISEVAQNFVSPLADLKAISVTNLELMIGQKVCSGCLAVISQLLAADDALSQRFAEFVGRSNAPVKLVLGQIDATLIPPGSLAISVGNCAVNLIGYSGTQIHVGECPPRRSLIMSIIERKKT